MANGIHRGMLVVLVAAIAVFAGACSPGSLPSDATLEREFAAHRSTFERLATMAEEDRRVVRIAPDFTWLEDNLAWPRPDSKLGFSVERWNQYRQIFRELSLDVGTNRRMDKPGVLFLIASAKGLVTGGSDKGYAFSQKPPGPLHESLDSFPQGSTSGAPSFKHLDGNWYLYLQWDK